MFPIIGIAVEVHHGNDHDVLGFEDIKNPERESVNQMTPNVSINKSKRFRRLADSEKSRVDFVEKFISQSGSLLLVPIRSLDQFRLRFGMIS